MSFLEILADKKKIAAKDIPSIQEESESKGISLERALLNRGVTPEDILQSKGEFLDIPVRSVGEAEVPSSILDLIPQESAAYYQFAPLAVQDGILEVGVVDPDNIEARDALNFISSKLNMPFKLFLITEDDLKKVLNQYKGLTGEVTKALGELETEIAEDTKKAAQGQSDEGPQEVDAGIDEAITGTIERKNKDGSSTIVEDAPVAKMVGTILRYAIDDNASDVHIEHMGESVRVRFRVDGVLNTYLVLPPKVHQSVVARIKILSAMRLDEKRKPQDSRFSAKVGDRKVDFRVSTFPAYYGEKVVMRILDQAKGVKSLEEIGISTESIAVIRKAMKRPYGMILISGPTGSGKSTTLYAMLKEFDRDHKNVLSLEDPIEYNIDGVTQSQIRPDIGYTFATGLRTTLRQDPDIIMVGEIRDKETAQLAIQAALTGHVVLSTIHTNNSIGVIPRLMDMGVDPYLIPPTLVLAIAQRLVRTLVPGTGKPLPIEGSVKAMVDKQFEDLPEQYKKKIKFGKEFKEIEATEDNPTGTKGRMAVMELLEMDKEIEKLVLTNAGEAEIYKVARAKGMLSMKEDAIIKAFDGLIPFEEVAGL
ncbi:MAG: GspE/PulE family protein [Minisyncoccia bacterium]